MEITWVGSTIKIRFPDLFNVVKSTVEKVRPTLSVKVNNKEVPFKFIRRKDNKFKESQYKTFQIIPHSKVKNDKVVQLPNVLADSYQELFERLKKGGLNDPERLFFETKITNKSYQNYITTNTDMFDIIQQQAQMVWKDVTLKEVDHDHSFNENEITAFNIKLKYPLFLSLRTDKTMQQIPLEEILEVSRFLQNDDEISTQFGIQSTDDKWFKDAERERIDFKPPREWINKEFSKATNLKAGHFGFDFVLRLVIKSKDERRRRQIARGIILALKQLNHDNELQERQIKPYRMKRFIEDIKRYNIPTPFIFGKRQIITPPEIAHLMKLPQHKLQEEYPIIESVTGREIEIPNAIKKSGISLGDVTFKGEKQPIYMPINNYDELCLPRTVIGGMGSGKTKGFGANWIVNSVNNGFGALAIDPAKGEIGDEVSTSLPKDKFERIKLGDVPIALDWCEVKHSSRAKNRLANTIIEFFNTNTDETGAQTARYLRAAVMGMRTGKLKEIIDIFTKEETRKCAIINLGDNIHSHTLIDFNNMTDKRQAQVLAPILNRLDTILGDQYLADCMESEDSLDMVDLMSQRKAFIIDVPKSELGPEAVDLIVNLLSTKIDLAMTLRKEKNQFPFFVVFDEPHQFLKSVKTWKSATVESRKWRVGYVWMFHSWEQIPRDLAEIIKSAGPHYHLYTSSKKTFQDLSEEIAPFTVEDGLKLKKFHAINVIRAGSDGLIKPVIAKMNNPPSFRIKCYKGGVK